MRRREFIAGVAAAAVWPFVTQAQQTAVPVIGFLNGGAAWESSDAEGLTWKTAFALRLQELGWMEGRNLTIHYRFGTAGVNRMPDLATELIALQPDVILAGQTTAIVALRQSTFSIPIVFAFVLALCFLLLLVTFRSLTIPLTSIVLNLLSVAAAYGVLVWIFQQGHLQGLLGREPARV